MVSRVAKTVGFQFGRGVWDVVVGLISILLGRIDALAGQVQLQKQRATEAARTPSTPGSRLLQDRMKKQRAAAAVQSESDDSLERHSPAARKQLSPVERFLFKKIPLAREFVCRHGVRFFGQCRFSVFACCLLQALVALLSFATSISPDDGLFLSTVKGVLAVGYLFFRAVGPIICIFLSGDVSNLAHAYRRQCNMPTRQFRDLASISALPADLLVSLFTLYLLGVQVVVLQYVPIPFLSSIVYVFAHSLYLASYAFEYRYMNQGMGQATRYQRIEENWAYYAGFGFPLAMLAFNIPNVIIASCIASAVMPVLIVSAYISEPDENVENVPRLPFSAIPMIISESLSTFISNKLKDQIPGHHKLNTKQN
ncbi:hypothetical protein QR680_012621 [Steinernema hermaphroditum]|uniref:EI24 domain-containing protein n=1 Tax=Steinernema hermaphroditum TaxID=289476 RepID=A0AA39I4W6_9BILA|nr:hypothetical protein QR680_012621 [Steinernema hermaphroditum]